MSRPPTDREALIAALAEQARGTAGGEPEPEELLDYLAGRLAPADEQRVSPEATRALLDLADFEAAGQAAGTQPSELAVRAGWRDLRGRLPERAPWTRRLPALLSSVAAALLVISLGLVFWVVKLQGELSRPVANVLSLTLQSDSRAVEEEKVVVAPGQPLRLVLRPAEDCPKYRAELAGPDRDLWNLLGLTKDANGNLTPLLPRPQPGVYRLRLFGCGAGHELEERRFRVVHGG
jgi:hypothetical protein